MSAPQGTAGRAVASAADLSDLERRMRERIGEFDVGALIEAVEVREVAQSGARTSMKLVYGVRFATLDPAMQPLGQTFLQHLGRILDAWIADAPVEVRIGPPQ